MLLETRKQLLHRDFVDLECIRVSESRTGVLEEPRGGVSEEFR